MKNPPHTVDGLPPKIRVPGRRTPTNHSGKRTHMPRQWEPSNPDVNTRGSSIIRLLGAFFVPFRW